MFRALDHQRRPVAPASRARRLHAADLARASTGGGLPLLPRRSVPRPARRAGGCRGCRSGARRDRGRVRDVRRAAGWPGAGAAAERTEWRHSAAGTGSGSPLPAAGDVLVRNSSRARAVVVTVLRHCLVRRASTDQNNNSYCRSVPRLRSRASTAEVPPCRNIRVHHDCVVIQRTLTVTGQLLKVIAMEG
jgi:hypothetical protein